VILSDPPVLEPDLLHRVEFGVGMSSRARITG
jgi:hypothetical protein